MGTYMFRAILPGGELKIATITVLDLDQIIKNFTSRGLKIVKITRMPFNLAEFKRKFL